MDFGTMHSDRAARCPGCACGDTICIGPLPDVAWFAGKLLAAPVEGGFLHRCPACHLVFRHPRQDAGAYVALYDDPAPATWAGSTRRHDWDLLATTAAAVRPDARSILDLGCHTGGLLSRFNAIPAPYGVEINAAAATLAGRLTGATIFPSLEATPPELKFDLITACDVIEHVPDPGALIRSLVDRLSADGRLLITTGDADTPAWRRAGANWWYCYYPEHIAFISRRWLEGRQTQGDFELLDCRNFRQGELSLLRRIWNQGLMMFYARWPGILLWSARQARCLLRKGPPASVPGNGVEADHLLVVLGKRRQVMGALP